MRLAKRKLEKPEQNAWKDGLRGELALCAQGSGSDLDFCHESWTLVRT